MSKLKRAPLPGAERARALKLSMGGSLCSGAPSPSSCWRGRSPCRAVEAQTSLAPKAKGRTLCSASRVWFVVILLLIFGAPIFAGEPSDQEVLKTLTTDQPRDKAVRKGLEFIRQNRSEERRVGKECRSRWSP